MSHYTIHLYNDYHSVHYIYIYIYIWWLKCVYNDIYIIWAISCPCISSASVYFNRLFQSIPRFFPGTFNSWHLDTTVCLLLPFLTLAKHTIFPLFNSTSAWKQISRDSYIITGSWICMNIYILYIYFMYKTWGYNCLRLQKKKKKKSQK